MNYSVYDNLFITESVNIKDYAGNIEFGDMLIKQWKSVFKYIIDKFYEYYTDTCGEKVKRKEIENNFELRKIESEKCPKAYLFVIDCDISNKLLKKISDDHVPCVEIGFTLDGKFSIDHSRIYFDG